MRELKTPMLMWIKAVLFAAAGLMAAGGILLEHPKFKIAALLAITVWCFARAYYFTFYVIEHYIDSEFRYAGLGSLVCYVLTRRRPATERGDERL